MLISHSSASETWILICTALLKASILDKILIFSRLRKVVYGPPLVLQRVPRGSKMVEASREFEMRSNRIFFVTVREEKKGQKELASVMLLGGHCFD